MFADYWDIQNLGFDQSVPVTTAWHILAANIFNKHSRTAFKGWSHSLSVWRSANNCSFKKITMLYNTVSFVIFNAMHKTRNKKEILTGKSGKV